MIIGIDLGTTNSAAAYLTPDGPRLIVNALGDFLTPSVVAIDETGTLLIGRAAKEYAVLHPERAAGVFKRYMGTDRATKLGDREFSPEELSSLILGAIKHDAEAHFGHPVVDAVITVPAYFHDHQRKATINAGKLAGLNVVRIINEPTAAAMAYGFHEAGDDKVLAVVDLGGGTFDVSLVELFEGTLEVRASAGESILGGEDFTRTICARLLERQGKNFERVEMEHPLQVARMLQLCETAKVKLSADPSVEVRMPDERGLLSSESPVQTVHRAEFETWTQNLLNRVELPMRRALGDAGLKRTDVHETILVGGATRMPMCIERMRAFFGSEPKCRLNPDHVVALGAAVQAALIGRHSAIGDLVVTDVAPFTLGISTSKEIGQDYRGGYFLPIIQRNTTIPCSHVESVMTLRANQTELKIQIFQGEHRRVENNVQLGEFMVQGIPRGPAGQQLDVRFTYDLNGVIEVEATIVATKQKIAHVITKHAKNLDEQALRVAIEAMQTLKQHPREDAVNRFLLRRAERLYTELTHSQRNRLSQLMDGFEEVLELKDAESIERFRDALSEFCEAYENGRADADSEFDDSDDE